MEDSIWAKTLTLTFIATKRSQQKQLFLELQSMKNQI